jgi:hypothetical protein
LAYIRKTRCKLLGAATYRGFRPADTFPLPRYDSAMRNKLFSIGLLVIALLLPFALRGQQTITRSVMISVSDQTGAGVAHAPVRIVPGPDGNFAKLETDDKGHLALNLRAGSYAVFVSALGFKKGNLRFDVAGPEGGDADVIQTVPIVLQIGAIGGPVAVYAKDSLVLTAELYHAPVALSPAEFRALPHVTINVHNAHANTDESYSGVPLANLLAMVNAPMGKELRGESLALYVVASGTDGYSAVLSLAEVDPSFHGGDVIVADTRDGKPLGQNGPFQLIVSGDKRPARWVRNLDSISVQSAR